MKGILSTSASRQVVCPPYLRKMFPCSRLSQKFVTMLAHPGFSHEDVFCRADLCLRWVLKSHHRSRNSSSRPVIRLHRSCQTRQRFNRRAESRLCSSVPTSSAPRRLEIAAPSFRSQHLSSTLNPAITLAPASDTFLPSRATSRTFEHGPPPAAQGGWPATRCSRSSKIMCAGNRAGATHARSLRVLALSISRVASHPHSLSRCHCFLAVSDDSAITTMNRLSAQPRAAVVPLRCLTQFESAQGGRSALSAVLAPRAPCPRPVLTCLLVRQRVHMSLHTAP